MAKGKNKKKEKHVHLNLPVEGENAFSSMSLVDYDVTATVDNIIPSNQNECDIVDQINMVETVKENGSVTATGTNILGNDAANVKPSWASLVRRDNRVLQNENKLHKYVKPIGTNRLKILPQHVDKIEDKWGFCLVGIFVGSFPGRYAVHEATKGWKVATRFYVHNSGWIIFKFDLDEVREFFLNEGPYNIFGRQLLLKPMNGDFDFSIEEAAIMPIWITLPGLPLQCWNKTVLSMIVLEIGNPLYMDMTTANWERPAYARALVEIDVSKDLARHIQFELPNGKVKHQIVLYEAVSMLCKSCHSFGHLSASCQNESKSAKLPNVNMVIDNGRVKAPKPGTNKIVVPLQGKGRSSFAEVVSTKKKFKVDFTSIPKPAQREGKQHVEESKALNKPNGTLKIYDTDLPRTYIGESGSLQQPAKGKTKRIVPELVSSPKSVKAIVIERPVSPVVAEAYDGKDGDEDSVSGEEDKEQEFLNIPFADIREYAKRAKKPIGEFKSIADFSPDFSEKLENSISSALEGVLLKTQGNDVSGSEHEDG